MSNRRDFIKKAALISTAAAIPTVLSSCMRKDKKGTAYSGEKINWKMVTTWSPNFPIIGEAMSKFSEVVEKMSGGRLNIKVYGGGELVPALESFDAVKQGNVEMANGAAYYWTGKEPAAVFFSGIPFGMNALQTSAWIYNGGGLKLWTELYEKHGLIPFPSGNTCGQMGGWFRKEIRSVEDFNGLKMRIPGIGGKVMAKLGANSLLFPGAELYTNLERGVLDALEWVGPFHDYKMGFHRIAEYYYYPGWQEPGTEFEIIVNKEAFNKLPADLKEILRVATGYIDTILTAEMNAKNAEYLAIIKNEKNIKLLPFPDSVLEILKKTTEEVMLEMSSADANIKKIYDSYKNYQKLSSDWSAISERNYKL
jgi:TRAP-type mannitol/chloroaromatic compound transport system substrate-binding protein